MATNVDYASKGGITLDITIAIDGPAGAGKSTIAKILSERFNLMYVNTGYMYRAVTFLALRRNIPLDDIKGICDMTRKLEMHFNGERLIVDGQDITDFIKTPEVSSSVSQYSAIPELRSILVELQRKMAAKFGVVMDGRDIGTVVLKDAPFKFFVTAAPDERAGRRCLEYSEKGIKLNFEEVLSDIKKRDYFDSHRDTDPLKKAEDAIEIDTSKLTIDEVIEKIVDIINKRINNNTSGDLV